MEKIAGLKNQTKQKQKSKPTLGLLDRSFYCLSTARMYLLWETGSLSSVTLWFYSLFLFHLSLVALFLTASALLAGSAFHNSTVYFSSFLHVTKFLLTLLLSSVWMTPFVKLIGMPCGRDAMQKKIIVLHNCPVLRDARSPLALEQTLLSGRSCESQAQCIWEVALSSTLIPRGWPLPQLR